LFEENRAVDSLGGSSKVLVGLDMQLIGKRRQGHGAAQMAQRAVITRRIAAAVMLIVSGMRILIGLGIGLHLLVHLMRSLLIVLAMRAKRHHGRGIALQRQPQHEADQEQFAR